MGKTLTQTGRGSGYRKNKHELRKLLLEEVELFNHADQQYQEDAEEEQEQADAAQAGISEQFMDKRLLLGSCSAGPRLRLRGRVR